MKIIDILLKEIEQEAAITRKMLALAPEDKYDWKPHPKSMPMGRLATHIAELPGWISMGLTTRGLDFAVTPYDTTVAAGTKALLTFFEEKQAGAVSQLQKSTEADLEPSWTLRHGDQILSDLNRYGIIRVAIDQMIHHRAQLGVYLRLLDIPIPGTYGPSADTTF